ncbi:MAG: rRNA maturation RNase YbeY [Ignavibacteria bacterium]
MNKNVFVTVSNKSFISKKDVHKIITRLKKIFLFEIESLPVNFVTSEEMHSLNKSYLKHDYSTDIITFNYSRKNDILDGEIFISLDDAFANSKKYKVHFSNEIVRLVIHGILHMLGYDDRDKVSKSKMKKEENRLVDILSYEIKKGSFKYGG